MAFTLVPGTIQSADQLVTVLYYILYPSNKKFACGRAPSERQVNGKLAD